MARIFLDFVWKMIFNFEISIFQDHKTTFIKFAALKTEFSGFYRLLQKGKV